ncbi:DNA-directed RNA polymerase subunit beta' [candidate division WWE3 bacterium RIFCSPHIGHO2_01_FULL_42_13]|uniref:DNA-directed RNA polymerase subunit beta' n=1 Tax=candidate division WWE3 bacterium RIFCSPHIGHO2_01_FULL_42_13 TaxID=1802617 RepID=A0A1F4UQP9_UNCKA|nr:MAG: DNA-directed RNA polymerase subunit beta' [candidate division WWE3 bacterium RIFCSPHIGHO2_01_FULL_42_13]
MRNLSQLRDFSSIKVFLASTEDILEWSYGEVTKPETINYRTFKPEREGLFDERIFGPEKDYECSCGKYKRIRYKGVICDKCGVEVTHSRVRRERMGHLKLSSPVAHVWFFRGIPSKMAALLDITPRTLESVIYFSSFIVTQIDHDKKAEAISSIEKDLEKAKAKLQKQLDEKIAELEKEVKKAGKGEEFTAKEAALRKNQKVMALRDTYTEELDVIEKDQKIILKKIETIELFSVLSDVEYLNLADYVDMFAKVNIGAEAIQGILKAMDLNKLSAELKEDLERAKGQKAVKITKRLKIAEGFRRAELTPDRMIMDIIPVIPPDLRPMVQLEGGRFATSDLNDLYRKVINRNNRLKRLLDLGAPEIIIRNEKRMLQESVDALFDQSKQRRTVRRGRGKQLRSLADMLKGKQGRFRQNLLGKRVDYSGRSVIINGPELKLDECGIPKEMALELFKPFVLKEILARGYAPNVKSAKFVLEARGTEIWDILGNIVEDHPVLLNRAPTLWRLGIQAFYPRLVEGNAVRLHLCVCDGYNADFDGDQMAVHLPLSEAAVKEAKELMLSTHNLLKPSDGTPMSIPAKTMLFGIYYMTLIDDSVPAWSPVFASSREAMFSLDVLHEISLRQSIKVRINGEIVETTPGRLIFNKIIPGGFGFINQKMDKPNIKEFLARAFNTQDNDTVVKLIDDLKYLGLKYGTVSGHSVALTDLQIPKNKDEIINNGREKVAEIDNNFNRGLITKAEARRLTENVWQDVTATVDDAVWSTLQEENPIKLLISSKAVRASRDQVKQIAGMRGLISDPTGKLVELPVLGNYKDGLSALEYFASARGARKGLADRALKTADSGYLSRRLVDVAQDVIVREEDCGTEEGRSIKVGEGTVLSTFAERVSGRYLAEGVRGKNGSVVINRGTMITPEVVEEIEKSGIEKIKIRTPLSCETKRGICAKCYGNDLMTRELIAIGRAVGVSAAQSIGEPGTQLTMRTFHTGGIAGKDITQGLPRIEEIFEARTPKNLSTMSEITGRVQVLEIGEERKIIVTATDKDDAEQAAEYLVEPLAEILVEDGQLIAKGEKLTAGHLDLTDLVASVGVQKTKDYIIDEVQKVYSTQGVAINDKHIEVIVSKMFNHVQVADCGDTDFLPKEVVTKDTFREENERILAEGGVPGTAEVTLLGITKAALQTDSFLSAASFINTSTVLTDAAASGRVDQLLGLKENVILGRLIPTGERSRLDAEE